MTKVQERETDPKKSEGGKEKKKEDLKPEIKEAKKQKEEKTELKDTKSQEIGKKVGTEGKEIKTKEVVKEKKESKAEETGKEEKKIKTKEIKEAKKQKEEPKAKEAEKGEKEIKTEDAGKEKKETKIKEIGKEKKETKAEETGKEEKEIKAEDLEEVKEGPAKEEPTKKIKVKERAKIQYFGKRELAGEEKKQFKLGYKQKKSKPRFIRQELYKLKRLKDVWRKPRGIDSKKHLEKRGKGAIPKLGYKKPDSISGVDPSGYRPVLIHNMGELGTLNPDVEAAIISKRVGMKKRNEIIKLANEKQIAVLNPRKGELE